MKTTAARLIVCALAAIPLFRPAGLLSQDGPGARIVVTRLDGSQVKGELIAVRPDSLLVLDAAGGDESIGLAGIRTVRVVRRAPTGLLSLAGFLAGAGAVGASLHLEDEETDLGGLAGLVAGILGAGTGLAAGLIAATDMSFPVAGSPDEFVKWRLERLKRFSREGRACGAPASARRPRFRLGLASTMSFHMGRPKTRQTESSWRLLGGVPSEDAGPRATTFYQYRRPGLNEWALVGPVSLAYELTDRWLVETEMFIMGNDWETYGFGEAKFVSAADGRTYGSYLRYSQRATFDSLLAGLVFRPVSPSRLKKAAVEVGIAAGPARIKLAPSEPFLPAERKTVLAANVRVAYDHHFVPAFSLGVFINYRYIEAVFPEKTVSGELDFWDESDPSHQTYIFLPVETAIPARFVSRSGLSYGLRLNFWF